MGKILKKYERAFYATQKEVSTALRPYGAKCCAQYFDKSSAIETFVVYSKEQDAFEGRHRMRGIVTVWYGYPINPAAEHCSVNISFDSCMVGYGAGDFDAVLAKALPSLPPEPDA